MLGIPVLLVLAAEVDPVAYQWLEMGAILALGCLTHRYKVVVRNAIFVIMVGYHPLRH